MISLLQFFIFVVQYNDIDFLTKLVVKNSPNIFKKVAQDAGKGAKNAVAKAGEKITKPKVPYNASVKKNTLHNFENKVKNK